MVSKINLIATTWVHFRTIGSEPSSQSTHVETNVPKRYNVGYNLVASLSLKISFCSFRTSSEDCKGALKTKEEHKSQH